jgi:putative transposase
LHQATPAAVYEPSRHHYPRPLQRPPEAFPYGHSCRAENDGFIRWHRHRVFISAALGGEYVSLGPGDDGRWQVYYGPILLGTLDDNRPERGLILPPRRKRRAPVSTLSLGNSTKR